MPEESYERLQARNQAAWYLGRWVGKPYIWGGDDWSGFDCSGLACEVLQAVGLIQRTEDYTADELWHKFFEHRLQAYDALQAGCLVFWFTEDRATHVEMMHDQFFCIGASGGGKPRWEVQKLYEKYPVLHNLIKLGDSRTSNPFHWLLGKMLRLWESDLRNAYIKMNPIGYRGHDYRVVDPFKSIA